ncbi:unnamed protein product [Arabidopsis lyrata]|nr:unnamed protein product [Arabidopsis lyrata]
MRPIVDLGFAVGGAWVLLGDGYESGKFSPAASHGRFSFTCGSFSLNRDVASLRYLDCSVLLPLAGFLLRFNFLVVHRRISLRYAYVVAVVATARFRLVVELVG